MDHPPAHRCFGRRRICLLLVRDQKALKSKETAESRLFKYPKRWARAHRFYILKRYHFRGLPCSASFGSKIWIICIRSSTAISLRKYPRHYLIGNAGGLVFIGFGKTCDRPKCEACPYSLLRYDNGNDFWSGRRDSKFRRWFLFLR